MKTNQEYKNAALAALKGNWAPVVLCSIVYMVVAGVTSTSSMLLGPASPAWALGAVNTASFALAIFVTYPLGIGYYNAHKELLLNGDYRVTENSFRIGFSNWGHNVWGMILMGIYVFLWTLLLVIPGIIKAFAYAMVPYILVDKPELSADEAIELSMNMMKGHKFDFFWLCLSFVGWIFLGMLTLGIGYFWLIPYMYTTYAAFYQDVKAEYEAKANLNN